jgi:hypothetical protein
MSHVCSLLSALCCLLSAASILLSRVHEACWTTVAWAAGMLHAVLLQTQLELMRPHSHTLTLSHSYTLTLSHSHTLTLSHSHTLTLSHSHTLTLSRSQIFVQVGCEVVFHNYLRMGGGILPASHGGGRNTEPTLREDKEEVQSIVPSATV